MASTLLSNSVLSSHLPTLIFTNFADLDDDGGVVVGLTTVMRGDKTQWSTWRRVNSHQLVEKEWILKKQACFVRCIASKERWVTFSLMSSFASTRIGNNASRSQVHSRAVHVFFNA